jgi:hypothetical protein
MTDLIPGTTIEALENERTYVVRLPTSCGSEDIEHVQAALALLRVSNPDHAPRFIVCRHDVEIEPIEEGPAEK